MVDQLLSESDRIWEQDHLHISDKYNQKQQLIACILQILSDSIFIIRVGNAHQQSIKDNIAIQNAIKGPVEESVPWEVFP